MPPQSPETTFVPAVPPKVERKKDPFRPLIITLIAAFVLVFLAFLFFSKPEIGPSTALFERLFPQGSAIRELERINLDIESILQHPVFRTLEERGPLPLEIPPLGKPNPFI
jgi:hypothetical protein